MNTSTTRPAASFATRRNTKRRAWLGALLAAACAGVLLAPAKASAQQHAFLFNQATIQGCASQAGNVLDRRVPYGRGDVILHPKVPNGQATDCSGLTWAKVQGKIAVMTMAWKGRSATYSQWDCNHSSLVWGVYRKSGASWVWVNGGFSTGNSDSDTAPCRYDGTGFPASNNWGAFGISTGMGGTDTEYRIAYQAWSHDDPNFGHVHNDCADPVNCTWPVEFKFLPPSGTTLAHQRQDWVIWTPSSGNWYFSDSATGARVTQQWGAPNDLPVHGDWDGDYNSDFAVARISPDVISWFIINSTTGQSWWTNWGNGTNVGADQVLRQADFDGDGRPDLAVWRPSTQQWIAIQSGPWATQVQAQAGSASSDRPVVADFDNDMRTDLILYRASLGRWRRVGSLQNLLSDTIWGTNVDIALNADFDSDYKSDIAVFRVTNDTFYWIDSSDGKGWQQQWGALGDIPVSPSYIDTDNYSDRVVYRQSEGRFYYVLSGTGSTGWTTWGASTNDSPAPNFMRGNN